MAEILPSTPQTPGLPETLATVLKWRDVPIPLTEEDFNTAVTELSAAIEFLKDQSDPTSRATRAIALGVVANLHRDHGLLAHALPLYDAALADTQDLDDGTPRGKFELANLQLQRGICRLSSGQSDLLPSALEDFDASISLRNELPLDDETQRWGLATALLHRGDVLHRSEGREQDARDAFDAAISQLRELPYQSNPSYLQRLALATSNRGLVAQDPAEARRCFDDAIALIPEPQNPPQLLTLCSALLNRGRHSLQIAGDSDASSSDARQVLTLLSPHEKQHPSPAELALQGRLLLSHALCTWLDDSRQGPGEKDDWVGDATDAVEDALALERHWEQLGYQGLRPVARELFQLGLHVYRVRQPHFFAEFLVESMDPEMSPGAPFDDPGFQSATGHALRQAVEETARRASAASLDPQIAAKQHAILESLRAADHRLASLQQARAAAKG